MQSTRQADGADIFDVPGFARSSQGTFSLKQPPKWLRRPASVSWGFGGTLVTVLNTPSTSGKNQNSVVYLRKIITENVFINRAQKLQAAVTNKSLNTLAEEKSLEADGYSKDQGAAWKALLSLFRADSRDELVTLLGFSKSEVAARVAEAVANVKKAAADNSTQILSSEKPQGPVVSFAEPESDGDHEAGSGSGGIEKTPSEVSANTTSDVTNTTRLADGESITTTAPSLFGDENAFVNPQDAEADFFNTIGVSEAGVTQQVIVPHHNYGFDSSVAATAGSGPSSVASENIGNNVFSIYPSNEADIDRLVTKALVLGDFESAVELCFSSGRFADAILLAVKGGPELLNRTQKTYFDRKAATQPYLRLFQSIVTNDLADIVENADLKEWQEIFVVLCTFATKDEFSNLAEVLGRRLEFQWNIARNSHKQEERLKGSQWRKNATINYLAAGRLERLVDIWIEELSEEETHLMSDESQGPLPAHTAHAQALQTFIEKVAIFRSAINYVDEDLQDPRPDRLSSKLSRLYDCYLEYAHLLANQGLLKVATEFFKLVPQAYFQASAYDQDQLLAALTLNAANIVLTSTQPAASPQKATVPTAHSAYPNYAPEIRSGAAPAYRDYNLAGQPLLGPSINPYVPPPTTTAQVSPSAANIYTPQLIGTSAANVPSGSGFGGPRAGNVPPPPPPQKRRENGGWNDAPVPDRPSSSPMTNTSKPAAITSPFPNASPSQSFGPPSGLPYVAPPARIPPPPPPRPSSVQGSSFQGGSVQLPVGITSAQYSAARSASGPPRPSSSTQSAIPPRMLSPPQSTDQGKALPPPGFTSGQTLPSGQYIAPPHGFAQSYAQASPPRYGRATPPQGHVAQYPGISQQGAYAPPAARPYDSPQNAPLSIPTTQPPPPAGPAPSVNVGQRQQHLPPSRLIVKAEPPPPKYRQSIVFETVLICLTPSPLI
jgi:protein transport protein SEC31